MARIAGVPANKASLLTRMVYRAARRRLGLLPEPLTVMAHQSGVLWSASLFELGFARCHRLDPRLKELAMIKAGALVGCPW